MMLMDQPGEDVCDNHPGLSYIVVTLANISTDWKDVKSSVAHEVNL